MTSLPATDDRAESWQPLRPLLLRDVLVYELGPDRLLVSAGGTLREVDSATGLVREHLGGVSAGAGTRIFDGEVVLARAEERVSCAARTWEPYEQFGTVAVFVEVSELESRMEAIENDAYDRDDSDDFFAFMSGHQVPVSYSLQVIVQALDSPERRIRLLAASALGYLVRHRAHGCYTRDEEQAVEKAARTLEEVARARADRELAEEYARCLKWPEPLVPLPKWTRSR